MNDPTKDLEALAGMTQAIDAANPDPAALAAQEQAQTVMTADEQAAGQWAMLMMALGGMVTMVAPELRPVYTQQSCFSWGAAFNEVAKKYGWQASAGNMPELALFVSTIGFVVPTYLVISQKIADAKAAKDGSLIDKMAAWWRNRKAAKGAQPAKTEPKAAPAGA